MTTVEKLVRLFLEIENPFSGPQFRISMEQIPGEGGGTSLLLCLVVDYSPLKVRPEKPGEPIKIVLEDRDLDLPPTVFRAQVEEILARAGGLGNAEFVMKEIDLG